MDYGLYKILPSKFHALTLRNKNKHKSWEYGYNKEHDIVIISRDGTLGEVYDINGLKIGLPAEPKKIPKGNNIWEASQYPKELSRIKTVFEWNKRDNKFKDQWIDYIEGEYDKREYGHWFINNGKPTYITGSHYMYLQWTKIDVGKPEFREANRIFFLFWEACVADNRSFGMCYLKNRRSGFSFMSSAEAVNTATITRDARVGILSKTGADAKKMFTDKVVPISNNYPFFFKPIQDGMDKPKTELGYRIPASKITKKNMYDTDELELDGLDTVIDWKNTSDNSYDGEKLLRLVHDECYSPETKILMADWSFKPIKDIKVGDSVTVEGGIIRRVVKKTSGSAPMYRVKQKWGEDYIVSENHRLVLDQYMYNGSKNTKYRKEVIMTPTEYLGLSEFKKQHTFSVKSKGLKGSIEKPLPIPPYLLGLWLGDGRQSALTVLVNESEEPEVLEYLRGIADFLKIPYELKKVECKKIIEFAFKGANNLLRDIGVYNNKHIPDIYMKSSIDVRLQVLAGLIDSDGYSDKIKNNIEFGMSRKGLIEQIRVLSLSCGLSCSSIRHTISNYSTDVYTINISGDIGNIPMITAKKSFKGYTPFYTNRRCGMSVEKIGMGDYVGIQVDGDGDDERKLILNDFTISLNSGKWERPENILNNWRVTKTCLRLGRRIVGKCLMGSTCNALDKGGGNFKKLFEDSEPTQRNANGQTKSGLYSLFVPMEWNFEGYIDKYGWPVFHKPTTTVEDSYGDPIDSGVIDYWENEVLSLKGDADALNEFYRQFPRTTSHAFRDESKSSIFNLTKIYHQIDYNDNLIKDRVLTRGSFHWKDGVKDGEVVWAPERTGRFTISWMPPMHLRNRKTSKGGIHYPGNEHLGSFGCDPYDISSTTDGRGSKGSLHGLTKFNMDDAPSNEFFLEYIARPQTAEIFFEDVLMACVFYGMPILAENNKPRLLYFLKNRGYRPYSINRPDKLKNRLSRTEKELGGIPNTSEDIKQAHAAAIESYIEKHVGLDLEGTYRDSDEMGSMFFNKTLTDWAKFDINKRTKHDASISSGLAIMANQKHLYQPQKKESKISVKFARYSNKGNISQIQK
tara:strand:- start:18985 stop:22221 length:3237 start_codon:yes stop_codon:yes gene_type:complete